jgi:RNA polymerase sigma factor (sigma-70 family)
MNPSNSFSAPEPGDAELVRASRAGSRDAFGKIVARYQSLVCALAYSATGSVGRSEDIAQDTFISAWRQLPALREPAKLRAWLCGIARNLTLNAARRAGREPVHQAEPIEAGREPIAPEPPPPQQAIHREEEAILWRALGEIPELYREPMVLYYREHQSVSAVAQALGLGEDAVKQRLSRGRALLQAQVAAFVEGTLARTGPDRLFTLEVLAALPVLASTGAVATGAAVVQGSASTKSAAVPVIGTVLTAGLLWLFSQIAAAILLGLCLGYLMSRACERSARQRRNATRFWRTLALGFAGFVLPGLLVVFSSTAALFPASVQSALVYWLALIHVIVPLAVVVWARRWQGHRIPDEPGAAAADTDSGRSLARWLALGLVIPGVFFAALVAQLFVHPTLSGRQIPETAAAAMIAGRGDATFSVELYRSEPWTLRIRLPENPRFVVTTPATAATLALLAQHGRAYAKAEYREAPLPFRWVYLLSCFVAPAGLVILLRRPWRHTLESEATQPSPRENAAAQAFALGLAFVLLVVAGGVALVTPWRTRAISPAEVRQIVTSRPGAAEFRVLEYQSGQRALAITLREGERPRRLTAPADPSTLAFLAAQQITCRRVVQGPDFTFADPSPAMALLAIVGLLAGAGMVLRWRGRATNAT